MAKKRPASKKAKPAVKGKVAKKAAAKKAAPRKPRYKQPDLNGVDRPKDRSLDAICERIADHRTTINEAKQAEDQDKARALDRMKKTGIESYTAHGVELVHTTTDKLRVRLVDDDSGAGDQGEDVAGAQGELPEPEDLDGLGGN